MPVNNDIIQIQFVQEYENVQMSNTVYWQIDDVGVDPAITVGLQDIMDAYVAAVAPFLSSFWKLVCGIYENITNPEGEFVIFATSPGTGSGEGHPQKQVLRLNRYATEPDFLKMHRGSFSQSGTIESQSTRGRVNNLPLYADFKDLLTVNRLLGGDRWSIQPHLRSNMGTPAAPNFRYDVVNHTQFSGRLLTLSSRKTDLCATST